MHLIIGLSPIGGNVGANLIDRGRQVYGYDLDTARVAEWADETGSPHFGAVRRGATVGEVADALGVAILMNGGPGTVHAPRAFEAFQEFAKK